VDTLEFTNTKQKQKDLLRLHREQRRQSKNQKRKLLYFILILSKYLKNIMKLKCKLWFTKKKKICLRSSLGLGLGKLTLNKFKIMRLCGDDELEIELS
jgi:hypothetical protein